MPATFIVFMSFTSLWLDRTAVPARVSLGVTTVLTTTTLMSSSKVDLPHTSYPKVNYMCIYPKTLSKGCSTLWRYTEIYYTYHKLLIC